MFWKIGGRRSLSQRLFGGGINGHEPPSSTKLDINNNKNNIVVRQRGGVRQQLKQRWWSTMRRLKLGDGSGDAWLGERKLKTGGENGGGEHNILGFVYRVHYRTKSYLMI